MLEDEAPVPRDGGVDKGWELAWQVHNTGRAVVKVGPETECVRVGNILAAIGLVVTVTQS